MGIKIIVVWSIRLASSFIFDCKYYLLENLKIRIGAKNYAHYRVLKHYPDYLKYGAALKAVVPLARKYCKGSGVDVGASIWPLPGARAIDNSFEENALKIRDKSGSLDFVFSSHTLEHLDKPDDALAEWIDKLCPGGILFLYLPHPACEMWWPEHLEYHMWSPDPVELEKKLKEQFGLTINYITYLPDAFFSFVIVANKPQ